MRIKDFTDTIRHLTDSFNIPEARRMIQENPALTQEQFKVGGLVEPGVTHYGQRDTGFIKLEDIDPKEVKRLRKTMSMQQIADEIGASKANVERVASGMKKKVRSKGSVRMAALEEATEFFAPGKKWKDFAGKERSTIYRQILDGADMIMGTGQKGERGYDWEEFKIKSTRDKATNTRLQWIADNGTNYDDVNKFIKAYEKNFGHKLGSKADALFYTPGTKGEYKRIPIGSITGLTNADNPIFSITKGFSEEEIFKGSIIQNNKKVQKQLKNLFENIDYNLDDYVDKGPESIVKNLKKQGGELFGADKGFDWIKATTHGKRDIGGVHKGIVRNSLLKIGIPEAHLKSFQEVRQPLRGIQQILMSIKERPNETANRWGVGQATAMKIGSQLDNFLAGRGEIDSIIRKLDYALGSKKFNEIFGGVNFEHTLAKRFGQDYKYLPRNYLLKGQFTSQKFNIIKRDEFDKPLMEMMKDYTKNPTDAKATKIQNHIKKFNAATNNYADFTFDSKKGKLVYPKGQKVMYDLSRYADKGTATKELVESIRLGQTKEFQKAYAKNPFTQSLSKKSVQSFTESTEGLKLKKQARQFIIDIGCPGLAAGGRVGFAETGSVNCFNLGREKIKTGQIKPGAEESNFKKLIKAAKGVRGVARATGLGLAWEAAFAPIIVGWMGSQGESWERMKHELAYGPILEALGVPAKYVPGISAEEELTKYMGKDAFDLSKIYEMYGKQEMVPAWDPSGRATREQYTPGERDYLQMELNAEINRSANTPGKSYKQYQIEQQIKKLEEKGRPLVESFYEGPVGQHFAWDKLETADEDLNKGLAELEEAKKAKIAERQERGFIAEDDWAKNFNYRGYRDGGIVSLLKK